MGGATGWGEAGTGRTGEAATLRMGTGWVGVETAPRREGSGVETIQTGVARVGVDLAVVG